MKTALSVVAVSLSLAVQALAAPGFALAQGFQSSGLVVGGANLGVSRSVAVPFPGSGPVVGGANLGVSRSVAVPFPPQVIVPPARQFVRPLVPITVVAGAPPVVYAAPPDYTQPPAYYTTNYYYSPTYYQTPPSYADPTSYAPPVSSAVMPPVPSAPPVANAPQAQNVVQFPTGRYEMRGDGITTPITWVWIPNPPTAPPTASSEPASSGRPGPRTSRLFRWTDDQGVVHLSDRLDAVPEQYRGQIKQPQPS